MQFQMSLFFLDCGKVYGHQIGEEFKKEINTTINKRKILICLLETHLQYFKQLHIMTFVNLVLLCQFHIIMYNARNDHKNV